MDLDPVEAEERSDLAGNIEIQRLQGASPAGSGGGGADVSTSNYPSVSSSSSEDQPDKSTGSGGKPPEIPWVHLFGYSNIHETIWLMF